MSTLRLLLLAMAMLLLSTAACTAERAPATGEGTASQGSRPVGLRPVFRVGGSEGERRREEEGEPHSLYLPVSVALDSSGQVYVLDAGDNRVVVFGESGEFQFAFGRGGDGPGEFDLKGDETARVVVNANRVVTFERRRLRVQVFSLVGDYLGGFRLFEPAEDIALSDDIVLVTPMTPGQPAVRAYDLAGRRKEEWGSVLFDLRERAGPIFNGAFVAARGGRIAVLYKIWPLLLIYGQGSPVAMTRRWIDFRWWDTEEWNSHLRRPESLLRRAYDASWNPLDDERLRYPLFQGIAFVRGGDIVALFTRDGPVIQFMTIGGDDLPAFRLLDREGRIPGIVRDMAVTESGNRACVVATDVSRVNCYDLPWDTEGD